MVKIRNAIVSVAKADQSFWDAFGVKLPEDDRNGDAFSATYQRAFRKVFNIQ